MKNFIKFVILFMICMLVFSACDNQSPAKDADVEAGEEQFNRSVIGSQTGCSNCHSIREGEVIVGPSLAGIGSREDPKYIRESILDPDAEIVDGFSEGTMPDVWDEALTPQQVDQLVAYLLTLK